MSIVSPCYFYAAQQMYIKRDGSIHGPLWPRDIKDIVLDKLEKRVRKFLIYKERDTSI